MTGPGDIEIRILKDGRLCLSVLDEQLLALAEAVCPRDPDLARRRAAVDAGANEPTAPQAACPPTPTTQASPLEEPSA